MKEIRQSFSQEIGNSKCQNSFPLNIIMNLVLFALEFLLKPERYVQTFS